MLDSLRGWLVGENGFIATTVTGGSVGIQQVSNQVSEQFTLEQNYPNPFNPSTKIKFDIPAAGSNQDLPTKLSVYNSLGKEVAVLVNENLQPGSYEYTWDAGKEVSGIYFYTLSAGDFKETRKMMLIK